MLSGCYFKDTLDEIEAYWIQALPCLGPLSVSRAFEAHDEVQFTARRQADGIVLDVETLNGEPTRCRLLTRGWTPVGIDCENGDRVDLYRSVGCEPCQRVAGCYAYRRGEESGRFQLTQKGGFCVVEPEFEDGTRGPLAVPGAVSPGGTVVFHSPGDVADSVCVMAPVEGESPYRIVCVHTDLGLRPPLATETWLVDPCDDE